MTRALRTHALTALIVLGLAAPACTMKKQEAPDLTGPSELGTSITVSITPDTITQDGASQSLISVTARNVNGQPVPNLALRIDLIVDGAIVDFGTLSARTVTTGPDGRAEATFTPPASGAGASERVVTIAVTPIGTDFNSSVARTASVRLIPQGPLLPPSGLVARFVTSPASPVEDASVLFDASTSEGASVFQWDFGNRRTGSGPTATTVYDDPGSYFATLTIRDEFGRSASTTRTVTVGAASEPSAAFTFSPLNPRTGEPVNFNAAESKVPSGRRIVQYRWDFGDGTFGEGQTPSHSYSLPRTYTVVLTVTDDTGRSASASRPVQVSASTD